MVLDRLSEEGLRRAGLRLTRQRLVVAAIVRDHPDSHVTAEQVHDAASRTGERLPLATAYNTLNDLAKAGVLRRLTLSERIVFCKNPAPHHHFLDMSSGRLFDIAGPQPRVVDLPEPPAGMEVDGLDVVVRVRPVR